MNETVLKLRKYLQDRKSGEDIKYELMFESNSENVETYTCGNLKSTYVNGENTILVIDMNDNSENTYPLSAVNDAIDDGSIEQLLPQ